MTLNHRKIFLKTLRKTRKAFIPEYFCGFFSLFSLGFIFFKGIPLSSIIIVFVISFALFCFTYAEVSRIFIRYKISPEKLIIVSGIIKQNKKNVYFHPLGFVPDINVKQDRIQRVLNYGTIYVRGGADFNSFEIKDINQPHKILVMVEDLIRKNKNVSLGTSNKC